MEDLRDLMISKEEFANTRILIVDDQKLHYLYLKKILRNEGYKNIECLSDPLKVLKITQEFKPDLLILDMTMPQLDGFQIMEQINIFRKDHYLLILALSEDSSSDIRLKSLQSGATDFLNKPYENVEIVIRIRNMIEMSILHMRIENQNKILEVKVQERTKELRETQLDIIHRLARAAEFRDNTTGEHIIRMGKYCAILGKAMGLSATECELFEHASPLHDVGKIGIPDNILLKQGSLTSEEFEVMKTHANIGAQLLSGSNSPVMKMAQQIALTHQEKWDGTGYPQHLKGNKIPLIGQICSICDVFDALTSERPYKKAWSVQEAIEEIIRVKGKHFTPELVDRFLEILPEFEKTKNQSTENKV